jgi:hypothetical protein
MRSHIAFVFVLCLTCCAGLGDEHDRLAKTVAKLNEKCPVMIDSETRLDGIDLPDEYSIRYNYSLVHFVSQKVDTAAFYRAMWPGIVSNIKVSPEMKRLREMDLLIQYTYRDSIGKMIYDFKVHPEHYRDSK